MHATPGLTARYESKKIGRSASAVKNANLVALRAASVRTGCHNWAGLPGPPWAPKVGQGAGSTGKLTFGSLSEKMGS